MTQLFLGVFLLVLGIKKLTMEMQDEVDWTDIFKYKNVSVEDKVQWVIQELSPPFVWATVMAVGCLALHNYIVDISLRYF